MAVSRGYDEKHTIPRDIVATRVVFYKGNHYIPRVKSRGQLHSNIPIKMRDFNTLPNHLLIDPNFKDYRGHKFGYFTVMGICALDKYDKWVLRCSCGCYEILTAKAIRNYKGEFEKSRCLECQDLERLRNVSYLKEYGYYPWEKSRYKKDKYSLSSKRF